MVSVEKSVPATHKPRIAVYAGTFDPLTLGHEDLIRRGAQIFDTLIVAVAVAHHKKTMFTLPERLAQVKQATQGLPNVKVLGFEGLLVDFCQAQQACNLVRGVRHLSDFDYEMQLAAMNSKLCPTLDTIFLAPKPDLQCISSTLVREISQLGGKVSTMVNPDIAAALQAMRMQLNA